MDVHINWLPSHQAERLTEPALIMAKRLELAICNKRLMKDLFPQTVLTEICSFWSSVILGSSDCLPFAVNEYEAIFANQLAVDLYTRIGYPAASDSDLMDCLAITHGKFLKSLGDVRDLNDDEITTCKILQKFFSLLHKDGEALQQNNIQIQQTEHHYVM